MGTGKGKGKFNKNNGWADSSKFNSKDRIVTDSGQRVTVNYGGHQYRIIAKHERYFTCTERLLRCFRGILDSVLLLTSLFSTNRTFYLKRVKSFLIKQKKIIRFAVKINQDEEQKKSILELQTGMAISEKIKSKIVNQIKNEGIGGINFYESRLNHQVFSLDQFPGLIFKMGNISSTYKRFQTMIKAQTIVRIHNLGLLYVPHAVYFTVGDNGENCIIAEQKLKINPDPSAQKQYFHDYAANLNETIRQLAIFICQTGSSDIEWRNIPILDNREGPNKEKIIGLIDVEENNGPSNGLFGSDILFPRRGLVRCVNEEQGRIIEVVAKQHGIKRKPDSFSNTFEEAFIMRKEELKREASDKNKL